MLKKKHQELFCVNSSKDVLDMLLSECNKFGVEIYTHIDVEQVISHKGVTSEDRYKLKIKFNFNEMLITSKSLVVATGALSIPSLGGSGFGYDLAKQFNLPLVTRQASLVPLMFSDDIKNLCKNLSGLSTSVVIRSNDKEFEESMLFTHRGLSGPAVLQISNYWNPGDDLTINLLPGINAMQDLLNEKNKNNKSTIKKYLSTLLPKALVLELEEMWWVTHRDLALSEIGNYELKNIGKKINSWKLKPAATEGYRTAEVTLGGVDTGVINSKTMEINGHPGLFFIGEVVDVTGHLGGYNFQWAWSSGYSAGLAA